MKIIDGVKLTLEVVKNVEDVDYRAATLPYSTSHRHMLRLLAVRKPYVPPISCIYKTPYNYLKVRCGTNDLQILRAHTGEGVFSL